MKNTSSYLSIFLTLIFLYACQTTDKEEDNTISEEISKAEEGPDNQIDTKLTGRMFRYGLGCSWDSQSQSEGRVSFSNQNVFTLEFTQAINQRVSKDYSESFQPFIYDYKFMTIQGNYTYDASEEVIIFEVEKYSYGVNKPSDRYSKPFLKDSTFSVKKIKAKVDSCQGKLQFVFINTVDELPQEKYYQWVEQNFSGKYISYAEGVREELIIQDNQDTIDIFYQSPKYKSPIRLIIKDEEYYNNSVSFKVFFPADTSLIYKISIHEKNLWSSLDKQVAQSQQFFKVLNDQTDNPRDLSLREMQSLTSNYLEGKNRSLDTIIQSPVNIKVRINEIDEQGFEDNFNHSEFISLTNEFCPEAANKFQREYPCFEKIEEILLGKSPQVKKEGDILIFELANTQNYFMRSNRTVYPDVQEFWYRGQQHTPYGDVFLAKGYFYEWWTYYVIHPKTGEAIEFSAEPAFSKDGRYLIAYDNIMQYEMDGVKIQIWEVTPYGFDMIWEYIPGFIPDKFSWIDEKSLVFNIYRFSESGPKNTAFCKLEIIN